MSDRWFRRLLRLYPRAFRHEFDEQMVDLFREMRAEAESSVWGRLRFVYRVVRDTLVTATIAWARAWNKRPSVLNPRPRSVRSSETMFQDIRFAVRTMIKRPGFTAVVVATLALGIGANTAIFSLVNEVMLRPLPVGDPQSLVDVFAEIPGGNSFSGFSHPDFLDYRERNEALEDMAAFTARSLPLGTDGRGELVRVQFSSTHYFDLIEVQARTGRTFLAEDGARGSGGAVAVVSQGFWQRRTGSDPSFVGKTLVLNETPFTVIGIAPPGFEGTFIGFPMEVWVPLAAGERVIENFDLSDRASTDLEMIGRLRPDMSVARAQAGFDRIVRELEQEYPLEGQARGLGVAPTTGVDHSMRSGVTAFLAALMVTTGLVLLITCLNVGNMLLARAAGRGKEMAIRRAMGAGRARLVNQLMTEVVVLFAAGAFVGFWVAQQANQALIRLVAASDLPLGFTLPLDWRVLSFTAAVALIAALVAGVFPAREALRNHPVHAMRAGATPDNTQRRWRDGFVVVQIAGTVVLLAGSGLFVRSLREGLSVDPGFDADRVAVTTVTLPQADYDAGRGLVFYRELIERAKDVPGVGSAALATGRPIGVSVNPTRIEVPGFDAPDDNDVWADANRVDAHYFDTVGISILRGRAFEPADDAGPPLVIVNETMARLYWSGEDPVGATFIADGERVRVVGVARDSRTLIQDPSPAPLMYLLLPQTYQARFQLLIRSEGDPLELRAPIQEVLNRLDATLPPIDLTTPRETMNDSLLPQRVAASVTSVLGGLALLLAVLGIYGVVSHSVSRRTKELGLRMAIGGSASDVVRLVMFSGLRLFGLGAFIGGVAALGLTPLAGRFLLGVPPSDPVTLVGVLVTFLAVAALASFIPARRATAIDPTTTLRFD